MFRLGFGLNAPLRINSYKRSCDRELPSAPRRIDQAVDLGDNPRRPAVASVVRFITNLRALSCNPAAVISLPTPYSKNRRTVTVIDTDTENGIPVSAWFSKTSRRGRI